ncbi:HAD hydrolase-like protein [Thiocapsa marina]|uniref:HAD-superfamily hydrolase, subfamily IA, variant 1 n=1 Tax=Thiocapsa marina 5811 TaxID=768671 RepID=F9UHE2_9GAMM|nr:HAD hydrolase-like protein [Thiocapsa marina]EGV16400.1 HAD-superfamily hydrolase, subfamily IA, variant 1 [Thiocapsa marina 5811]
MAIHILFDFDGTLVDSLEAAYTAFRQVGPEFGCAPLSRERLERLRGMHALEVVHALGVPMYRLPQLATRMRRAMRADLMETAPIEGIGEVLEMLLQRGHRLGILSSNARASVHEYIRRHRLPGLEAVVGGTGLFGKAGALRRQVRRQGIAAECLIYVGDELRDLEAAREAQVPFAAVAWGYTPLARLAAAGPDYQCRHPRDLLTIHAWIECGER